MKSISKLKKELDKWFSLYIRLRDATDEGLVECFTCGKVAHYKKGMQNGHFQSRKHYNTRWNEDNVKIQCPACNVFRYGEQFLFSKYLGNNLSEELLVKSRIIVKFTNIELEQMIIHYSNKLKFFL